MINQTNKLDYKPIELNYETDDYKVISVTRNKSTFDLYNEIIVYGKNTKSIRRDLRSINTLGKKTLEVYDSNLVTLNETDAKALELLKLHTDLNEKIIITVGHKQVSQLRSGDIVELEIARENIHRNKYLVLQVEHLLLGNMKLELGRYSKQLEDRFAEIAIEQRNC